MTSEKQEITWDLTELFPGPNDPSIEKAINEAKDFCGSISRRHIEEKSPN